MTNDGGATGDQSVETEAERQNAALAEAKSRWVDGRPTLAATADRLEDLRAAVVDAAAVSGGLWLSYLFVLFYLLIAAGGVTLVLALIRPKNKAAVAEGRHGSRGRGASCRDV